MGTSEPSRRCRHCGTALTEETAGGLCPRCLLEMSFATRTMPGGEASPRIPPPSPGEMAAHFPQFEILECLGRGGMGIVYKARQKSLDRLVAIKVLADGRHDEPEFAARFSREARTLAKMSHPNIVTVFDHGETDGLFYIVMEFIDGVNLRDLMREGTMAPEQALAIVPPICEALEYAHDKGVVHRDIKPENLLLDRDGRVKIADFGIASLVGATGEKSGTPPYMAPEQENGVVDRRADIYALGAVLYEMLTGERPAEDLVAPSKRVEVDVKIDEMVLRALEKEPERRYQTAGEFRTVVETIAKPPPAATSREAKREVSAPSSPVGRGAAGWRVLRVFSVLGLGVMLAGIAMVGFLTMIVPRWVAGWADVNRSLSFFEKLLAGGSEFCLRVWPPMLGILVVVGVASAVGFVITVKRQRRAVSPPPPPGGEPRGMFRRWWGLGLAVLLLSPLLGVAGGWGWSQWMFEDHTGATAVIQLPRAEGGEVLLPAVVEELLSAENCLRVAEELELPRRWGVEPGEAARRIQRTTRIEQVRNTALIRIRVRNYGFKVPDGARDATEICEAVARATVARFPDALLVDNARFEFHRADTRLGVISMIVGGFVGVLTSPLLALLAMWLAHRVSSRRDHGNASPALANLALGLAILSGLIPTLFYWLRPLHGDWLTDSTVGFMLWVTLVAAVLALVAGWIARRHSRARTGMAVGGIILAIWLLMFTGGQLSSGEPGAESQKAKVAWSPVEFSGRETRIGRTHLSWRVEPGRPMIVTCGWYALEGERMVAHQALGNPVDPGDEPFELVLEHEVKGGELELGIGFGSGAGVRGTRAMPGDGFRSVPNLDPVPLTDDRYTELWRGECLETDDSGEKTVRTYVFVARVVAPDEDPRRTPFEEDCRSGRFGEVMIRSDGTIAVDPPLTEQSMEWEGTYRGTIGSETVEWRIVKQEGEYHCLRSPREEVRDANRLRLEDGALLGEDSSERVRFTPAEGGLRLEVWLKGSAEKVGDLQLTRIRPAEPPDESGADQPDAIVPIPEPEAAAVSGGHAEQRHSVFAVGGLLLLVLGVGGLMLFAAYLILAVVLILRAPAAANAFSYWALGMTMLLLLGVVLVLLGAPVTPLWVLVPGTGGILLSLGLGIASWETGLGRGVVCFWPPVIFLGLLFVLFA